jgi:hypothetical protein
MNSITFGNPLNVVSFCEKRLAPSEVDKIIQEGKEGLSNTEKLNGHLAKSEYIPVLKAIWRERDRARRLTWLQSHASELHAPLMFEQALAEFVNVPTIETLFNTSLPLIRAAVFRVEQDSVCSADASVCHGDAPSRMLMLYQKIIFGLTQKHLQKDLALLIMENETLVQSNCIAKVLEVARLSLTCELPSPTWIGFHGLNVMLEGKILMHPDDQFKSLRVKKAHIPGPVSTFFPISR